MFCPKCGQQNPDNGKFCRGCGTDLGNVSQALSSPPTTTQHQLVNRKGKPISYESSITKIFSGLAFVAVAIALAFSIGKGWWFWLLIPAFTSLGAGVAQYIQLKKSESNGLNFAPAQQELPSSPSNALPSPQTSWATPESRYKTGDLAPPSVTDGTTRHLEMDSEGKTMTLPKQ
jgi:hypothetical protein